MAINKKHSKALPSAVKERLQFSPTPAAKSKSWGKEWVPSESVRRDIRADARVDNNPQRDPENNQGSAAGAVMMTTPEYQGQDQMIQRKGFKLHKVGPLDDEYTNQHNPEFYEEITSAEGVTGFLERQNYLDRI